MSTDLGAGSGARNPNLPVNWSNEMNLMNEALARAHCWEQQSAWESKSAEHRRQLAQQLAVARADRSARMAERLAAFAARRAGSRRKRADLLASGLG